jgi:putative transposase
MTMRYEAHRDSQEALRIRLRELAGSRVRYGKRAQRQRLLIGPVMSRNEKWSMDFVTQLLSDNRWIRILTVVDQFTRECLAQHANTALSGEKIAASLDKVVTGRGEPLSITADNGTEFASKVMDLWAYTNNVHPDFIRPARPTENGYIESFNGRLHDKCLNVEVFFSLADDKVRYFSRI